MSRLFIFIALSFAIFISCQNQITEKPDSTSKSKEIKIELTEEEALKREVAKLRAGNAIKNAFITGKKVVIEYAKDYKELKKIYPKSTVTEKDWEAYWGTTESIQKALNDGSVRLMKNLDFVEETEVIIHHKGKTYSINVSKDKLEKFLGKSFEEVKKDWLNNFNNEFVFTEKGREKFFKEFGKIK